MFDADRAGKDKSLGKVDIPAADLAASAQGRWFPLKGTLQATSHRLNVELDLQSLFGPLCTVQRYSLAETPQLPLMLIYVGAIGLPR